MSLGHPHRRPLVHFVIPHERPLVHFVIPHERPLVHFVIPHERPLVSGSSMRCAWLAHRTAVIDPDTRFARAG